LPPIRVAIEEPTPVQTSANSPATSLFDVAKQLERWASNPHR